MFASPMRSLRPRDQDALTPAASRAVVRNIERIVADSIVEHATCYGSLRLLGEPLRHWSPSSNRASGKDADDDSGHAGSEPRLEPMEPSTHTAHATHRSPPQRPLGPSGHRLIARVRARWMVRRFVALEERPGDLLRLVDPPQLSPALRQESRP